MTFCIQGFSLNKWIRYRRQSWFIHPLFIKEAWINQQSVWKFSRRNLVGVSQIEFLWLWLMLLGGALLRYKVFSSPVFIDSISQGYLFERLGWIGVFKYNVLMIVILAKLNVNFDVKSVLLCNWIMLDNSVVCVRWLCYDGGWYWHMHYRNESFKILKKTRVEDEGTISFSFLLQQLYWWLISLITIFGKSYLLFHSFS